MLRVVTKRMRLWIHAAEMNAFHRVSVASLRRSSVIWEKLRVELLLLHIEKSQLRWFSHLTRMPPGQLLGEVF